MDVKRQNHKQQNSTTERSLKVTKLGAHAMVMSAQTHCCHSAGSPSSHTVFRYLSHACLSEEKLLILVLMTNLPPPHQRI